MNIGILADKSGLSVKTIRYYESIGLVTPPKRGPNGYRIYRDSDVQTFLFITQARKLGFSLNEISNLLALWRDKERASSEVKNLALKKINEIDHRIHECESIKNTLSDLAERCRGDERPDCPIIHDLTATDSKNELSTRPDIKAPHTRKCNLPNKRGQND